ncbi:hypothetical protein ONZ45_g4353 [Pleurotus djamor]|nr:hypothetical protein ONZ45_g4353 [Pleurotus djamor]
MDSLLAIATGLALRAFVSQATNNNRTASTLIGLWEGIVLMHFLKKMPRSYDPYVAYGVRLFVDFLWTESVYRLMVVLLWTGLGMVIADITPIFWYDMGVRRSWSRFRRDLYILTHSIQSLFPFNAKPRSSRVRFHERTRSASRGYAPTESIVTGTSMPSATRSTTTTTSRSSTSTATPVIPTIRPQTPARPRRLPGTFPGIAPSEADTDSVTRIPASRSASGSSVASDATATPRIGTSRSQIHLHEPPVPMSNMSSSSSTISDDTEVPELPQPVIAAEIPDIDLIQQATVSEYVKKDESPRPPPIVLPPTPADTLRDVDIHRPIEVPPPSATMPVIPDQNEWGWENIDPSEVPPMLLQDDVQEDRKGKGRDKSLPPAPEDIHISMPVPHPAPTPILPVPEPHSDRHDSPPPPFEDIYGPDADDVQRPVDIKSSLIDLDDSGEGDRGDPGGVDLLDDERRSSPPEEVLPGEENTVPATATQVDEHQDTDILQPTGEEPVPQTQEEAQEEEAKEEAKEEATEPLATAEEEAAVEAAPEADAEPELPPPSPSPPPSPTPSEAPPLDERIPVAFSIRQRVLELSQELKTLQQAQAQAVTDGDKAEAVAQKVEVERTKRELERTKRKLARRIFEDNNATAINEINLAGMMSEDAINFVEETLEKLLLDLDHKYTELTVLLPPGKKGGPVKFAVTSALEEHQIFYNTDPKNGRKLIIELPHELDETEMAWN